MEAIIAAGIGLLSGVVNMIAGERKAKYDRLPDWMTAKDFQRKDYTIEIIAGILMILIALLIFRMTKK